MFENELYHYGVLGMKWGVRKDRQKYMSVRQALGTRKVAKYQEKAAAQVKTANRMREEQAKMSDPKNWKKYYESKAEAKKYSSYSKKRAKAYEDAGRKWLETNNTINKMSWEDARAAKELYKTTVDEVFKRYGYKIYL